MNKLKQLSFFILLLAFSCQEKQELVKPQKNRFEKVDLQKDTNLQALIDGIASSNSNQRQLKNGLGELNLNHIVGYLNDNDKLNYSILLNNHDASRLIKKYLKIAYRNGRYWAYIIEHEPLNYDYSEGLENYTGLVRMRNLAGEVLSTEFLKNGIQQDNIPTELSGNQRLTEVQNCEYYYELVRVDNWTGSSFGEYEWVVAGITCEPVAPTGNDGEGDSNGDWGTPIEGAPLGGDGSIGGVSGGSEGDTFGFTDPIAIKIIEIGQLINLSNDANTWLVNNPLYVNEIYDFLINNSSAASRDFAEKAMEYIAKGTDGDRQAALMTFELSNRSRLKGPYDANYFNLISSYKPLNIDISSSNVQLLWLIHFSSQCALIKAQNPSLSDWEVYWEASKETWHLMLDLGGLVPVVGEVCDLTNALIYKIEGDGLNASLSAASAVPFAGWIASGVKLGFKGPWKLIVKANGDIYFGARNSEKFRKALGLVKGDGKHAHHLIPWSKSSHPLVQKAAKSKNGFHLNETLNGIPLPSGNHLTGHSAYSAKVTEVLDKILESLSSGSTSEAYLKLKNFIEYLDDLIKSNPNKTLGEIANLINYPV